MSVYALHSRFLSVFDAASRNIIDSIGPLIDSLASNSMVDIVVTPDGRKAYASGFGSAPTVGRVFAVDTTGSELVKTLEFNQRAYRLALRRDGRRLYATSNTAGTVQVIDTATDTVVDDIPLTATGIAIAPAP
jgi:YVTN family beta-propeller protein